MTRLSSSLVALSTYLPGTGPGGSHGLRVAALIGLLFANAPALQAQTPNVIATWTANTESDIAGYVLNYGTQTGNYSTHVNVANTTTWQGSLTPGVYYFAVDAYNTSNESSPNSAEVAFTIGAPPTVSMTAPADRSTVFGVVSVTATASDVVGVTGLQFQIDGASQGLKEVTPPYSLAWNSTSVANGTHTIGAVASDAAGLTSSSVVSVTVANVATVPNVVNLTQASATTALVAASLTVGTVTTSTSATVAAGSVISESPVAGSVVARGSAVALVVSSGSASVTVPNVVGMTQGNATSALVAAGLTLGTVTTAASSTVPTGSVISQNPVAGALVAPASAEALVVSSGPSQAVVSIWSASVTPAAIETNDTNAVELGVKFRSDVNGRVTGVRFYKGPTNTGTHTGSLWSSTGTRLATATFSGESASGWQTVTFSTPVSITANTVYVVSYHTKVGNYANNVNYFASSGADAAPLHALANGVSGNGVYHYGAGFPTSSWDSTNYWVDLMFVPQ